MSLDQALQHLKMDGWYVMEGIIPEDEVDTVRESVERSTIVHCNPDAPDGIGHVPGFVRYDQSIAPYLADRRMLALAEALLGPHVRVSFMTGTINYPGNERGGWHGDWPFNQNNAGHIPAPIPTRPCTSPRCGCSHRLLVKTGVLLSSPAAIGQITTRPETTGLIRTFPIRPKCRRRDLPAVCL